jgi:hypothetical protein
MQPELHRLQSLQINDKLNIIIHKLTLLENSMAQTNVTLAQLLADEAALVATINTLINAFTALKSALASGTVLSAADQAAVDAADAQIQNLSTAIAAVTAPVQTLTTSQATALTTAEVSALTTSQIG